MNSYVCAFVCMRVNGFYIAAIADAAAGAILVQQLNSQFRKTNVSRVAQRQDGTCVNINVSMRMIFFIY